MASPFESKPLPPNTEEIFRKLRDQRDRLLEDDDFFGDLHNPLEQLTSEETKASAAKVVKAAKWAVVKYVLIMATVSLLSLAASVAVILGLLKLFGVI